MGLATVEMGSAKAASWNGPTMAPRICQPRSPPRVALSSLYAVATSGNFWPSLILSSASRILLCFSHRMWRTLMALPPFFSSLTVLEILLEIYSNKSERTRNRIPLASAALAPLPPDLPPALAAAAGLDSFLGGIFFIGQLVFENKTTCFRLCSGSL